MLIVFFVLGLIIGSFLNVIVYRLNIAESILGRSYCPQCKKKIRWYDNVPLISFILLRGECRDCKGKISWQYPLMELASGIVFVLVGNYFFNLFDQQSWLTTLFYLAIFSMLLVIFAYDLKFMEIPMLVLWIAIGLTVSYYLFIDWTNFSVASSILSVHIFSAILAGAVAFLFFFLLASFSKEKWMGLGDAYVALLTGLLVLWPKILFTLVLAFALGSIVGISLILAKKKTMKSQIPFAPFLVTAIFLTILLPQIFPQIKFLLYYF